MDTQMDYSPWSSFTGFAKELKILHIRKKKKKGTCDGWMIVASIPVTERRTSHCTVFCVGGTYSMLANDPMKKPIN